MSGQRHLRIAALIIGASGALRLLWLALDLVRAAAPPVWWLEAASYVLLILVAVRLMKGSELAWFGAVLIFGGASVIGVGGLLDLAMSPAPADSAGIVRTAGLLAAGAYGVWVLLLSARVKAFRARHSQRDRFAPAISVATALAIICGIGWYLDRLSPEIQRSLAIQLGIAAAFIVVAGFMAARHRKAPLRWEFLPLVLAAIALIANLEAMGQLRDLRALSQALKHAPPDRAAVMAEALPGQARAITDELRQARDNLLARMEAETAAAAPWPVTAVLEPGTITNPAAIDQAAADLGGLLTAAHESLKTMDIVLGRFAEQRRRVIAPLPDPVRRKIAFRFEQEESAYRSHYGARVNLLSRARLNLTAMVRVLQAQQGRYTADWRGALTFEDPGAAQEFETNRAALEELKVWDTRLRAEGAALAASKPAWRWLDAID